MKRGDPSVFTMLVAQVIVNTGNDNTETIGRVALMYESISPQVKEICRQIIFKEFNFSEESFKEWHQDNINSFPTECAEFISFLITFYEPNLKIDSEGFYIPNGLLGLLKKRSSSKDLWDYYTKFVEDKDVHPLGDWRQAVIEK